MQKSPKERARGLPIHPLLIGLFPILSLMGHNIIEIAPEDGFRSLLVSAALVGLVWLLTRAVTRWSWARAGLAASLFAGLFFSYGHVYTLVEGASLLGLRVGRHLVLGPAWVGVFIAGVWGIRKIKDTATLTQALNLIGVVLLVTPLYQITAHELTILTSEARLGQPASEQTTGTQSGRPDVYYIILDAYTRDDTLLEVFDYDNTPFVEALEERGFVIPRCSRSNYGRTYLSLSSSLNMGYVQDFAPYNGPGELTAMIKDSAVRQAFTAEGYTIVAFDADFYRTQWPDADLYIAYESRGGGLRTVNEFEALATDTTALLFLLDANLVLGGSPLEFVYETRNVEKYNRVNFTFDTLEDFPDIPGPKFVWVHIPSPHGPYVFSETGRYFPDLDETPEGYRAQIIFLNQRVLDAVDAILARSEIPPIIIIQGDHGAEDTYGDYRRLNILNAYHLPGEGSARLYSSITPVNTFRLILDTYFDEELALLPDMSYFSPPEKDYAFELAPDARPGCARQ